MATAKPISENAAAQAIVLVDAAEEAERGALERCLADEAVRFEDDVEGYERLLVGILSSGEDAAKSAAAIAEAEKSGETEESTESPVGAGAKAAMATAQAKKESLRHLHEREIAAMALQNESKRRAIAIRLAQRRAAAKEARAEAMRADGKDEEEIAKKLAEVNLGGNWTILLVFVLFCVLGRFRCHRMLVPRTHLPLNMVIV